MEIKICAVELETHVDDYRVNFRLPFSNQRVGDGGNFCTLLRDVLPTLPECAHVLDNRLCELLNLVGKCAAEPLSISSICPPLQDNPASLCAWREV
jgi:hypothetical protein